MIGKKQQAAPASAELFGKDLSFAASEAYKLLRTNLLFALPDEQKCRVVGITSSLGGEGKSTTSLNLAYMLAETGRKVLLVEADMRLPTISKRLGRKADCGLSNLLAGLKREEEVLQPSGIQENLVILPSGDIPPNPSELLGSPFMEKAVRRLAQDFDFILLDLPPVNAVSDALVVTKVTDGILLVVRQDYANRRALNEAVRQLQYVEAKLLGFVMTYSGAGRGGYKSYKSYQKGGYGYGYEKAQKP